MDFSPSKMGSYPLVNVYIAMENHHFQWVNQRTKWAIFNSYVSLPEGMGYHCDDGLFQYFTGNAIGIYWILLHF